MVNVVVLNNEEEFIEFLNPNILSVTEKETVEGIGQVEVTYYIEDVLDAKRLFKMGNKLWVYDSERHMKNCLYVINTDLTQDFFKENNVVFTAEDKIVELNNVPFFSQTDLVADNGFTLRRINNEDNVLVDYNALNFWFGAYFNIGIVQDCLTPALQRITPTGTMSLMELLRYIEEETGNIFRTRYEKDVITNVIHPYLDFLNPTNSSKNWELNIEYTVYDDETTEEIDQNETIIPLTAEEQAELNEVSSPDYTPKTNINPNNLIFQLVKNGTVIQSWNAADRGVTTDPSDIVIKLKNSDNKITLTIDTKEYFISDNPNVTGDTFTMISGSADSQHNHVLGNDSVFRMYDNSTNRVVYQQEIKPLIGNVHEEILDLAYNVENIIYELNEEDSYNAIAPTIGGENNELNRNQISNVIQSWIDLEVNVGDIIPMIVQRITTTEQSDFNVAGKYYNTPQNPNNQPAQNENEEDKFEYWVGTAYWAAPFAKNSGEIFIRDETITDINYNSITTRKDNEDPRGISHSPKIGNVSTSDEDPYAIYNDVALKLKDKRYPLIDLEVDVTNLHDGKYNDYNIHDLVYIKVPGQQNIITARIDETTKEMHDIGETKVKLSNYSINKKAIPEYTLILADNTEFTYPNSKEMHIKLEDANGNGIPNQLISANLLKIESGAKQETNENGETYLIYTDSPTNNAGGTLTDIVYIQKTDDNGYIHLTHEYDPGKYHLEINYGGDIKYESSTLTVDINVLGEKLIAVEPRETEDDDESSNGSTSSAKKSNKSSTKKKTTTVKTTTKTRYYNMYGRSPDNKYIMAIGRPSADGEKKQWGTFYKTVFKNDCPCCKAKHSLYWNIYWAKNEKTSSGKNPAVGKPKSGSIEGQITCKSCDADWSITGKSKENRAGKCKKSLTVHKKKVKSNKTEAYKLKKGKMKYDTITIKNKTSSVVSTNNILSQSIPNVTIDQETLGAIDYLASGGSKAVYEKAHQIVKGKTGLAAAKAIANWLGQHISHQDYINFKKSAEKVLKTKKGDCCDQTRLMFEMWHAVGVKEKYTFKYQHGHRGNYGHVWGKINGVHVDPCTSPSWNHHITRYGGAGTGSAYHNKTYVGPNRTP